MPEIELLHDHLILDACCIINLFASLAIEPILSAMPLSIAVSENVADKEALFFYRGPADDITAEKEIINLRPYVDNNVLRIVSLDEGKIMINAGRDAGLRPGVVFEVFCADECVTAFTGQTYTLPSQKVGEIRIVSLKTRRALTEPVNGEGFEVGQIVMVKD